MPFSYLVAATYLVPHVALAICRLLATAVLQGVWRLTGRYPRFTMRGVTKATLTAQLRKSGCLDASRRVAGVRWEVMEAGSVSSVHRLHLTYEDVDVGGQSAPSVALRPAPPPCTTGPTTIVVKVLGGDAKCRIINSLVKIYPVEVRDYRCLRNYGRIAALQPFVYGLEYAAWLGMGIILLEDLGHLRCRKSRDPAGATREEAFALARVAGAVHAASYGNVALLRQFEYRLPHFDHIFPLSVKTCKTVLIGIGLTRDRYPHIWQGLDDLCEPNFHELQLRRFRGIGLDPRDTISDVDMATRFVVNHGDLRLDNAFFVDLESDQQHRAGSTTTEARVVDWQVSFTRAPYYDLCWILDEVAQPTLDANPSFLIDFLTAYQGAFAAMVVGRECPFSLDGLLANVPWGLYTNLHYLAVAAPGMVTDVKTLPPSGFSFLRTMERLDHLLSRYVSVAFRRENGLADAHDW